MTPPADDDQDQVAVSLTRRVVGGTGLITGANGLVRLFTMLAAPVMTALLGPAPYAVATLVATLTALLVTVSMLGVDMSYARYYFGGMHGHQREVERLCWRFAMTAALSVALLGGVVWSTLVAALLELDPTFGVIVGATILLTPLTTMAHTRARLRGRYRRLAVAIVSAGAVTTLASLALAVWWRADAWALLVGAALGLFAGALIAGLPDPRRLLRPADLGRRERWEILRLGIPGVVTAVMFWVLSSADRWIIALYHEREVLGVYSFAASFGLLGMMLNSSVTLVWIPEASRSHAEDSVRAPAQLGRLWARLVALLAISWLVVTSAGGDLLRLVSTPEFHVGAVVIPWVALGVFFNGLVILATTGLILSRDLKPAAGWWLLGATLNVGLNFVLIPRWGAMGAAITVAVCFAIIAVGVMWSAKHRFPLVVPWKALVAALACVGIAGLVMSRAWAASPLVSLVLKLPVGVAVALAALGIIAPDWFQALFARRRRGPRRPTGGRPSPVLQKIAGSDSDRLDRGSDS